MRLGMKGVLPIKPPRSSDHHTHPGCSMRHFAHCRSKRRNTKETDWRRPPPELQETDAIRATSGSCKHLDHDSLFVSTRRAEIAAIAPPKTSHKGGMPAYIEGQARPSQQCSKGRGLGFGDTLIRVVSVADPMLDGLNLTPMVLDYPVCQRHAVENTEWNFNRVFDSSNSQPELRVFSWNLASSRRPRT